VVRELEGLRPAGLAAVETEADGGVVARLAGSDAERAAAAVVVRAAALALGWSPADRPGVEVRLRSGGTP
jgi:hypothetical protein